MATSLRKLRAKVFFSLLLRKVGLSCTAPKSAQKTQFEEGDKNMASAPTPTPAASSGLTSNVAAALSYITIVGIVFLVIDQFKNDKFVRFHSFQSVFFAVACFAFWIVEVIVLRVLGMISFAVLGVFSLLFLVVWLALFVVWVLLVVQAYSNKQFKLPIIGDLAAKQAGV
jgi:uncharacterized membrane protein